MTKKDRDILIAGIPRSGSNLVRNIINEVYEEEIVNHTHFYHIPYNKIIITYRDIRDCIVSLRRLYNRDKEIKGKLSLVEMLRYSILFKYYLFYLYKWIKLKEKKILWLRYERFFQNYDYLFDKLEDYLDIEINYEKRKLIKIKFNLKNQKKISDNIQNPDEFKNNLMKSHIHKGEIEGWKKLIPTKCHWLVYFLFRRYLLDFGYSRYGSSDSKAIKKSLLNPINIIR